MISSTARDLPEHREQVMHACTRLGMFRPDMMEHLTAADANALEVSLKMVDKADLYLGVFAYRYGYVPEGQTISVTEAEYNRAVERKIPRLIFLMSDEHPVKPSDVETGEGAEKLKKLKERLGKERVVSFLQISRRPAGESYSGFSPLPRSPTSPHFTTSATFPRRPKPSSRTLTRCCKLTDWSDASRNSTC